MVGSIPQSFIEDLLDRVPIADVVGSRVQLKKSGTSLKACCPFHQEKTPSFHVNVQKNFYHCFGCGAHGDAISFIRDYDNLSFVDAIEELAKFAGVEVPRDEKVSQQISQRKRLTSALEKAAAMYQDALKNHNSAPAARGYIEQRGLSTEILERFGIGFAPAERNFLSGGSDPETLKSLIATKTVSDKYERLFDLFQNRLMFPIRNVRGQVIGFGGRTLGDDSAKYINSPESPVFHKSKEAYGLYEANKASRQLNKLLVVEGYMDVVALAQYGINYAVATLGTATNNESLGHLLKHSQHLVFCFDGDNAGLEAARKAMENALPIFEDGLQLQFLLLPSGEDPDTLVRQEGKAAFEKRIENALPLSKFFFEIYGRGLDLDVAEQRGKLKQVAEQQIAVVSAPVLKNELRTRLNELTFRKRENFFNKGKVQGQSVSLPDVITNRVIRDPSSAICLALYYEPSKASQYLPTLVQAAGQDRIYEKALEFARYICDIAVQENASLIRALATCNNGNRQQFAHLFDRLDFIPDKEQATAEGDDHISRLSERRSQNNALQMTKLNKAPSQMTEEEKEMLRSISSNRPDNPI